METTLDFGLDFEGSDELFCSCCGRTNTKLIKAFDLRRFLCSDATSCLELMRRQRQYRALADSGEGPPCPPKALDLREPLSIPSNA